MTLLKRRGMALISALFMMVVLAALTGAFLGVNRANLTLLGTAEDYRDAYEACISGIEYVWHRTENDRGFGAAPFVGTQTFVYPEVGEALVELTLSGDGVDLTKNRIQGKMLANGSTFDLSFVNNLRMSATFGEKPFVVPPRAVRILAQAESGKVRRKLDVVLRAAPLVDASALAGGTFFMDVDAGTNPDAGWWLESKDPARNLVRSNGDMFTPNSYNDPYTPRVKFRAPEGLENKLAPPYGSVRSSGEVWMKDVSGNPNGYALSANEGVRDQAEQNAQGKFMAGSSQAKIPDLDPTGLNLPQNEVTLQGGDYTFRFNEGLERHEFVRRNGGTETVLNYWQDGDWITSPQQILRDNYGSTIATIDLQEHRLIVPPQTNVKVNGNLTLSAETGSPPAVELGAENQMAGLTGVGSLTINGSVTGHGSLVSETGSVSIRAKSTLSTSPDQGVAIFAEQDVRLSEAAPAASDGVAGDWNAYEQALRGSDRLDDWMEKGDSGQADAARELSKELLIPDGDADAFNALWLGLTEEFPADATAIARKNEWLKGEEIIQVPIEPPPSESDTGGDTTDTGGDTTDTGGDTTDTGGETTDTGGDTTDSGGRSDGRWTGGRSDGGGRSGGWPDGGDTTDTGGETDGGTGGDTGPPPEPQFEEVVIPGGGGITLERYIRLREYLKSVANESPDPTWLDTSNADVDRTASSRNLIRNQLTAYQEMAGEFWEEVGPDEYVSHWNKLSDFFSGSNPFNVPYRPDMAFKGLVYAKGNFIFDAMEKGFELEGAVIAKGNISIRRALGAKFTYNPELLQNFTLEDGSAGPLEQVYWSFR